MSTIILKPYVSISTFSQDALCWVLTENAHAVCYIYEFSYAVSIQRTFLVDDQFTEYINGK